MRQLTHEPLILSEQERAAQREALHAFWRAEGERERHRQAIMACGLLALVLGAGFLWLAVLWLAGL
ncbi:MAG: hypothetical protein ACREUY_03825 [Burkholderiales bacterium]